MKREAISELIENINPQYIAEAADYECKKHIEWYKWVAVAACLCLVIVGIFFISNQKYKRISFNQNALGDELSHINEDTTVIDYSYKSIPTQLPIYEITPHNITQQEFEAIKKSLHLPESAVDLEFEGNRFFYNRVCYTNTSRGYFDMTDEELEKEAWRVLNSIPFLKGEFKYLGIKRTMTINTYADGDLITRAGVQFQLLLDGMPVSGDEDIVFYFDGTGLVEIQLKLFDYKQIGTMDLVPLEEAKARIKTPDYFSIDAVKGIAQTLHVERTELVLVNQYHRKCTILQPIYNFSGTAYMKNGQKGIFSSKVIAIPESYTYDKDLCGN